MLPQNRLLTLLDQALELQARQCPFHNAMDSVKQLYQDHKCDKKQLPTKTIQTLRLHTDEVWFIRYSNDGRKLASASKDHSVLIWNCELHSNIESFNSNDGSRNLRYQLSHILTGHTGGVISLAWSPSDTELLSCSNDREVRLWNVHSGECTRVFKKHVNEVSAVAWLPDGLMFVSAGTDSMIYLWHRDGSILHTWTGTRVADLAIAEDGRRMVTVCHERRIRVYDLHDRSDAE